jgi:uncharacterized membrane protein (DUF485 family)
MAQRDGGGAAPAAGSERHPHIDWEAAERSPEFRELIKRRRAFVVPATIFFLAWFFGFILLTAYAPSFMGESVYEGLTVGYCLALSQFIMTWGLAAWYLRRSDRVFDPLAEKAAQIAIEASGTGARTGDGSGRFEREPAPQTQQSEEVPRR